MVAPTMRRCFMLTFTGMVVAPLKLAPAMPNDPQFPQQWYLQNDGQQVGGVAGTPGADVAALNAWALHGGTSTVTVAVVGSGISPHDEFGNRLLPGRAFVGDPFNTADVCGTGTEVAGIIGAARDNSLGIAGLAGPVKLLPVRVKASCSGPEENVALGMNWAVDSGADIIIVPDLHHDGTPQLAAAVDYAVAHDVLVIAPFGSLGVGFVSYPAKHAGSIAVTATDHLDQLAAFSYFGVEADLSAPGAGIWSTDRFGGYAEVAESGATAAALVAGAAALIKSYAPQLTAAEVRNILENSATDLGAPGWDAAFGWGRLDVTAALMMTPQPPLRFELLSDPPEMLLPGSSTVFDVRIANGSQVVLPVQARVFHRIAGGSFSSMPLTSLGSGMYRVTLPATTCNTTIDYYLSSTGHQGGVVREPLVAPTETYSAWSARLRTLFNDDMEMDRGWTTAPPGASAAQGAWTRGIPIPTLSANGQQMQPGHDFSPGTKQNCFYTGMHMPGAGVGTSDVDGGPYTLTSPEVLLTTSDALISYARWLFWLQNGVEDFLTVEVSRDGGTTWALAETVAHNGAWVEHSFRLSDFPSLTGNQLRVRFSISDFDASLIEAAVDEFRVEAIDCSAATGDGNNDGMVALNDHALMRNCMLGPGIAYSNPAVCALFDFDADGDVDVADAGQFALRFGAVP